MGWLTDNEGGRKMSETLSCIIDSLMKVILYALCIYTGVVLWLLFSPEIKGVLRWLCS
jgi:hypothetical protein